MLGLNPITSEFKLYAILATLAIVTVSVAGLVWYVSHLKDSVAILEVNNKALNTAVETQKQTMDLMQKDVASIQQIQVDLNKGVRNNNVDLKNLRTKFENDPRGKPRDFGTIAVKNPDAVARVINKGSVDANRCLEIASGSQLTEKEKNAKLKSEINTSCPALANPNYVDKGY